MHPTTAFGRLFAAAFAGIKIFRPDRPIHPQGTLFIGTLERSGAGESGIAWLDQAGAAPVTARLSRSLGVPAGWPDIIGLALRVETGAAAGAGKADVLLASTGWKVPARFVLLTHRTAGRAQLTSLMPYKGSSGPVLLAARTVDGGPGIPGRIHAGTAWTLDLFHARPLGPWTRFGTLTLRAAGESGAAPDTALRFDPLLNVLPGAETYGWTRRLREHSYRTARR